MRRRANFMNRSATVAHRQGTLRAVIALLSLSFLGMAAAPRILAHPEWEAQIDAVTAEITVQPTNAALLLRRADLHRQHAEFAAAHGDISAAQRLQPGLPGSEFLRARIFLDEGKPREALAHVEICLGQSPDAYEALGLRGRIHGRLGEPAKAVTDFSAAIRCSPSPSPDLLLERARAQAALGRFQDAITGLDEGMERVGPTPSLQLAAIELQRQEGALDAAIARTDVLLAKNPVKEPWLVLRAEILAQAGRLMEAKVDFQNVVHGIDSYSPARRALPMTRQLQARANEGLARVEAKLTVDKPH